MTRERGEVIEICARVLIGETVPLVLILEHTLPLERACMGLILWPHFNSFTKPYSTSSPRPM
jgi:hypothetical protein